MDAFAFKKLVAIHYYASFLHSELPRASMTRQTQLLSWQNLLSRILISFSSAPLDVIKETNLWTRHLPRLYFLPDWVRNPTGTLQRSIALWRWFSPSQSEHAWKQPCFDAEQSAKTTKSLGSKIDDGARLCFPLSYAIFTVLYFGLTLYLRPWIALPIDVLLGSTVSCKMNE